MAFNQEYMLVESITPDDVRAGEEFEVVLRRDGVSLKTRFKVYIPKNNNWQVTCYEREGEVILNETGATFHRIHEGEPHSDNCRFSSFVSGTIGAMGSEFIGVDRMPTIH